MSRLSPDAWQLVSPYLDQVLGIPEEQRTAWLEALRVDNPAIATLVEKLIDDHRVLTREGFLEQRPVPPVQQAVAGETIGAYTLMSAIGQGGMGNVWLAERSDGRFMRRVAIKFLNIALMGRGGEERFKREGSFLARLAHPHIAELVDAGVSAWGQPYLILEHVDGHPIDRYCDEHRLDVESRVRLFLDALAAVAHAHTNLIVHRDIKTSNVLVSADGRVKLLDFGIAKLLEDEGQSGTPTFLTREAGAVLTPEYAAPEQVTGEPVTTATDVYALGVLLYVLLTGQHPAGPRLHSPADLMKAIVEIEPPRLSSVASPEKRSLLHGDLDTIVAKTLKKDPQDRYASVTALADDLRRYLRHDPISARPDTVAYRAAKFVRRNRTAVGLATLALAGVISGVVAAIIQAHTARVQRDLAFRQLSRAEAINDLNSFLLSDAAPLGKPFTVNELLEQAGHILERQKGGDEAIRVEMLISVGHQYQGLDEGANAVRILEESYKLSRGLNDPSTRAKAACALGDALARHRNTQQAEALVQEGLRELPNESQYTLDRVFCLLRASSVARDSGASQEAIARAQAAQRLLKQSPLSSELLELRALMALAESYRIAGHHREAGAAFEEAAAELTLLGRDETQTAGTLLNDWGVALSLQGRPLEAESVFRRAIAISSTGNNEEGVSPMLLVNNARALRDLGRLDEAASQSERGYARAQQAGDQTVVNQSLLLRSSIYRMRGNPTRAAEMLSEAETRLRRILPAGHIAFAALALQRALIAQSRGELQQALALANEAVAGAEASIKAGRQGSDFLPAMLVSRADIQLQLHQPDAAAADAARALTILQQFAQPGVFTAQLGGAYLAQGRALQIQGHPDQAGAAFRTAAKHLERALGPDHPDTRLARQLAPPPPAQDTQSQ